MSSQIPITRAELARRGKRTRQAVSQALRPGRSLAAAALPNGRVDAAHPAVADWLAVAAASVQGKVGRPPRLKPEATVEPPPAEQLRRTPRRVARLPSTEPTPSVEHSRPPAPPEPPKTSPPAAPQAKRNPPPAPRSRYDPHQHKRPPEEQPTVVDGPAEISEFLRMRLADILEQWGSIVGVQDWLTIRRTAADIVRLEARNRKELGELIDRELVKTHVFGAIDGILKRFLTDTPRTLSHQMASMAKAGATVGEMETAIAKSFARDLEDIRDRAVRTLGEPTS